jgi:hypothetical protein
MNYLIHATPVHPSLWLQYLILLFTIVTAAVFILLLLLSFCYCYYYKTVGADKLLRVSLFPGAAELTTHLLRLINILWLPLCRINKFGFYFPRRHCGPLYLWVITPHLPWLQPTIFSTPTFVVSNALIIRKCGWYSWSLQNNLGTKISFTWV